MLIRLGYEIGVNCVEPTALITVMDLHPDRKHDIRWATSLETDPSVDTRIYTDQFGNGCRRLLAPTGDLKLRFDALVEDDGEPDPVNFDAREVPVNDLPDDALVFLLGSRYCETDHLSGLAWSLFGNVAPGWNRVQAICDYVHNRLSFGYGYARPTRTAAQAYDEQVGVCRDFTHLAVALCRCMNIPARYVNGYLGDIGVPADPAPMDFNAWLEVYLEGGWYTFDARHNTRRIGRVVIAKGRDATDIPMIYTFGPHWLTSFKVWTHVEEEGQVQHQSQHQDGAQALSPLIFAHA